MGEFVTIERMSYGPAGIAHRADGMAVFVSGAVTGDVVEIAVDDEKPRFASAHVKRLVEPSPERATKVPPCTRQCGGCPWAPLSYEAQTREKRNAVCDALVRVAHVSREDAECMVESCRPSPRQWGYRNKIELGASTVDGRGLVLGFHREGSDALDEIDRCPIAHESIAKAPKALRGALRYLQGNGDLGIYRVGVRGSERTGDIEVALWTPPSAFPRAKAADLVASTLKTTSITRVLAAPGKRRAVKKNEVLSGKGFWKERLAGFSYGISAPSFFQVNTAQAESMVEQALAFLEPVLGEGHKVADLYAGAGTFTLPLAKAGTSVAAVESSGFAVRDLRRNAERAHVDVEAKGGDAALELERLGHVDGLLVDPPRAGLAKGIVESIAALKPDLVVYVSCDPQTWARDIRRFSENGYRLQRALPFDLFPQTFHVETLSLLSRESSSALPAFPEATTMDS